MSMKDFKLICFMKLFLIFSIMVIWNDPNQFIYDFSPWICHPVYCTNFCLTISTWNQCGMMPKKKPKLTALKAAMFVTPQNWILLSLELSNEKLYGKHRMWINKCHQLEETTQHKIAQEFKRKKRKQNVIIENNWGLEWHTPSF